MALEDYHEVDIIKKGMTGTFYHVRIKWYCFWISVLVTKDREKALQEAHMLLDRII